MRNENKNFTLKGLVYRTILFEQNVNLNKNIVIVLQKKIKLTLVTDDLHL
jgi:hypothetical protein